MDLWLAVLASVVLGAMMVFIFASAVMRYAFNAPVVGGNEVLGLGAVAMVMLALPYTTTQDSHIRIDLFDSILGRTGKALTDALYQGIGMVVLWFLTRAYVDKTLEAIEFEDTTNMREVLIWPFYALVTFGVGTYGVILAGQLVLSVLRR